MFYLSGIHALNIEDSLDTCGDWHTSSLDWGNITLLDSSESQFRDWGIESNKVIPGNEGVFNVANTLRAILDLMEKGCLEYLKGFREDFICTDRYDYEFFSKVCMLRGSSNWHKIDELMKREFMFKWDNYKEDTYV